VELVARVATAKQCLSNVLRRFSSYHVPGAKPDIFLISTPRSGSTWLLEAIAADSGVRPCNEPLNLRKNIIAEKLGVSDWSSLLDPDCLPVLERYIDALRRGGGSYAFKTPRPFQKGYDLITNRVVFKILFGFENRISWLKQRYQAKVVCLVRHPIPVSNSREVLPRLQSLLEAGEVLGLTPAQRNDAQNIFWRGDDMERAQLDWTLQNLPLQSAVDDVDLFITYEQLVLQPQVVIQSLAETLDLASEERVKASFEELSGSVSKSSDDSLAMLQRRQSNKALLLCKWRKKIDANREAALMQIPQKLGIDLYQAGQILPSPRYWIGDDYPDEKLLVTSKTSL